MARKHRHLDGTEHSGDPTAPAPAATVAAVAAVAVRRPPPLQPSLVDARILMIAAVVASGAAFRVSQGLLSLDEMLTRYVVIAVGCVAASLLVRLLWPVLSSETATGEIEPNLQSAAAAAGLEGVELGELADLGAAGDLGARDAFAGLTDEADGLDGFGFEGFGSEDDARLG